MFELTNEQRRCFGLTPVLDTWEKVEVTPNQFDMYYTFAYLDGTQIRKIVQVFDEQPGYDMYREFCVDASLSEDRAFLLPKTAKGTPQKFNTTNLCKRTPIGMSLNYNKNWIAITNNTSCRSYYCSAYDDGEVNSLREFSDWVDSWCAETGEQDIAELSVFSSLGKVRQKYREGDFFRFRINRRLFGYGRILLDYTKLRKNGTPFWDIFMGKPLCVAVYHVATDNSALTPEDLAGKMMLPSQMIMDNIFYYGECKVIGNLPLTQEEENYTIHYGRAIGLHEQGVRYQCGKTYIAVEDKEELAGGFRNGGIGWNLNVKLPILRACISEASNAPYWNETSPYVVNQDLRNPKFEPILHQIYQQVGIDVKNGEIREGGIRL